MAAQVRAERDVLEHGHVRDQLHVLERPRDAEADDALRRRADRSCCPASRSRPPLAGSTPVIRLNMVLLPAPFGPISATISLRLHVERHVVDGNDAAELLAGLAHLAAARRPRLRTSPAPAAAAASVAIVSCSPTRRGSSAIRRGQSPPGATCSSSTSSAPNTMVSSCALHLEQRRQHALQNVLQDGDDARAQHRAPDVAGAADHGDEQILDAGVETERGRIHEQLEVRVEPAGQAGQHRGMDEDQQLHPRGRHAERFRRHMSAPQRAHGAAGARVEQVHASARPRRSRPAR